MQRLFSTVNDMVEDEDTFVVVLIGEVCREACGSRETDLFTAQMKLSP